MCVCVCVCVVCVCVCVCVFVCLFVCLFVVLFCLFTTHCCVCAHLDGLNAEDQFRVWVTILDNTSLFFFFDAFYFSGFFDE